MALPGLNTRGTNISVLPQYTPSNTALDLSALGSGISQGMGLVGQYQQAGRLRDIMAEENARRPLRDLIAQRQELEASLPIERIADIGIEETPQGTFGVETVESIGLDGIPSSRQRRSRVLETAAQRESRLMPDQVARPLAPLREVVQNPDGTYDTILVGRNPNDMGTVVGRVKGITPQQTFVPDEPAPEYQDAGVETLPGPGGVPFRVATVRRSSDGARFYRDGENNLIPFTSAPVPAPQSKGSAVEAILKQYGVIGNADAAVTPGLPGVGQPTVIAPAPQAPSATVIRIDPASIYGTR